MTSTRILVPVDFSERSRAALAYAAVLARQLKAEVTALHAWDCPPFARHVRAASNGADSRSLADLVVEQARRELDAFVASVGSSEPVTVRSLLVAASPIESITDAIRGGDYDLVVMGTHGRGAIGTAVLGSVACRAMALSTIPVLFVPERAPMR